MAVTSTPRRRTAARRKTPPPPPQQPPSSAAAAAVYTAGAFRVHVALDFPPTDETGLRHHSPVAARRAAAAQLDRGVWPPRKKPSARTPFKRRSEREQVRTRARIHICTHNSIAVVFVVGPHGYLLFLYARRTVRHKYTASRRRCRCSPVDRRCTLRIIFFPPPARARARGRARPWPRGHIPRCARTTRPQLLYRV